MSNLTAIGFTVIAGACGFTLSMLAFGFATSRQSVYIAARCTARPKAVIHNPNPSHACQKRGNVFLGWVPWVMKLTYATMLSGVPGTGTRDGGLSGLLLKVNLDGIVLIRFHHLCLRVSCLALLLYILIVLPVYETAQCSSLGGDINMEICRNQNLTDYQRLTIANIPPLHNNTFDEDGLIGFFVPIHSSILSRLYAVVFVSWVISWYTYVLLEKEWRDILALRRVYFLEADHWSDRNAELEETLLRQEREENDGHVDLESGESYQRTRDPWVHHPEQRDTVPNIQLYSILVGGLPSLPTEAFLQEDVKAVFSRKQSIDWQLAVTAAFFDHCVPNQPGFSSSVAAVTILPAASQITEAWKHWYKTAAKIRRLRLIRKEITKIKRETSVYESNSQRRLKRRARKMQKRAKKSPKKSSVYRQSEEKNLYYREVLGTTDDFDVATNFLHALKLGPEQTAVYSREFAQSAGNVAPYGWNESKVRKASLGELLIMEKNAIKAVQEASHALQQAQERIAENDLDGKSCDDVDLAHLMKTATTSNRKTSVVEDSLDDAENSTTSSIPRMSWHNITKRKHSLADTRTENDHSSSETSSSNEKELNMAFECKPRQRSLLRSMTQNFEIVDIEAITSRNNLVECNRVSMNGTLSEVENGQDNTTEKKQATSDTSVLGFGRNNQRVQKRVSHSELGDLGLEAGLFLEQRHRSRVNSMGNTQLPRPKSAESFPDRLLISENSIPPKGKDSKHRRVRSTDDIYFFQEVADGEDISEFDLEEDEVDSGSRPQQNLTRNSEDEERQRLGYEPHVPDSESIEVDYHSQRNPIWEKIADESRRRSEIKKRLEDRNGSLGSKTVISSSRIDQREKTEDKTGDKRRSSSHNQLYSITELDSNHTRPDLAPMGMSERSLHSLFLDQDAQLAYAFEEKAGLRRRQANATENRFSQTSNEKWEKVVQIANEFPSRRDKDGNGDPIENGRYTISSLFESIMTVLKSTCNFTKLRGNPADMVDPFNLAGESTFAVVTFTSRQAAVAARHCLADSRGADRWNTISDLPAPPLADAPMCNLATCVRPVTMSINDQQKMIRHTLAMAMLVTIYLFYIIPLTEVQQLLSPTILVGILPDLESWLQNDILKYIFSGFIPALVWTLFYAICPPMFKAIANFGSNATSAAFAEESALSYFWWFMIVSAFTGTSLASALLDSFEEGTLTLSLNLQNAIVTVANTIPTTVSAVWLNWIIVRVSLVLPTQYILQMNTYLFSFLGLKWLARSVQGGGSGGPIPYRIYVDSGVVMLCLLALAPASPLIAVAVFFYFLFCVPMLRWVLIFLYKPKFDVGGGRFPFIFDMIVSGMVAGQSLLGIMLLIRRAIGPAVLAFLPLLPIVFYRIILLKRYLRPFTDVALLQTSLLDGWDTNEKSSTSKREEFRQFLVDCHKAAYVPVCIASDETTVITSEPAVVVQLETDCEDDHDDITSFNTENVSANEEHSVSSRAMSRTHEQNSFRHHPYEPHKQHGRVMRRLSIGSSQVTPPTPPTPQKHFVNHNSFSKMPMALTQ